MKRETAPTPRLRSVCLDLEKQRDVLKGKLKDLLARHLPDPVQELHKSDSHDRMQKVSKRSWEHVGPNPEAQGD